MTITYDSKNHGECQYSLDELLDRTPLPKELDAFFNVISYQDLLKTISSGRTRAYSTLGRAGYPLEAMLKAYLATYFIRGIGSIADLVERLQSDFLFAMSLGFDITKPIPHRTTFSRFVGKLVKHQKLIDKCLTEITNKLQALLPDFGKTICVDCTPVPSWSNPSKERASDPKAGFIFKGVVEGRNKWVFGYRFFVVSDAVHELPIGVMLTEAVNNEKKMLMPLLAEVKQRFAWFKPTAICADAGFDKYEHFEGIVKQYDAEPIIALSKKVEVSGSPSAPQCKAGLPFIFKGWNKDQLVYWCPEKAKKAKCPLSERCTHSVMVLRPVHDYRKFGYRIPRKSQEWKELYDKRSTAERVNSRLEKRRLKAHCFRKRSRINLHVTLSTLAMQAMALSKVQTGRSDKIRVCGRKIG